MAISSSYTQFHPSYTEPGLILPQAQASGAFECLADGQPLPRLAEGDLYAYMKRIDLRTAMAAGQTAYNSLPGVEIALSMIKTPSYMLRVRAEWDHIDVAAAGAWGVSLPEAYRLGMRQGHFQLQRGMLLYGMNPQNGEGLINANGATSVSLPADTYGDTTIVTYDNGQLATYFLSLLASLKTRTNQLGIARTFVFLGPQRVMAQLEYPGIVQLTSYQRAGAGSQSVAGTIKDVAAWSGDTILWCYDDTLIGKGAGGNDAILVVMPEITKPKGGKINTNEFAKLAPGIEANTLMYVDRGAPTEIPTPIAGGTIDVVSEQRSTSGWAVRPEAVTILSAQYQ